MKSSSIFKGCILMGWIVFLLPLASFSSEDKAEDLFPKMNGWELNVGEKVYTPDNLWDIINGAADAYLSYDFRKLYTAEYLDNQERRLKVYIFEHSNPTNAFGIYSQERSNDYEFVNTGAQGFISGESYYFITGPYYVQISSNDKDLHKPMDKLANRIDNDLGGKDQFPDELKLFPEKGKLPHSEKYIANNFLGYSYLHSSFVADYKHSGESFQIFMIHPEQETEIEKILTKYLDFVEYPKDKRNSNKFSIEDPYNGSILLYRSGGYLYGVMGTNTDTKQKYLELIRDKLK